MHTKRVIPCLDVKDGRVVKGVNFVNFRDAGDPSEVAAAYDAAGADEVVFLDITASADSRATQLEWVRKVASKVFKMCIRDRGMNFGSVVVIVFPPALWGSSSCARILACSSSI